MSNYPSSPVDTIMIGGGFFGAALAVHLARRGGRVLLLEAGDELLTRASYANQARVHAGYHYPRSIMTALRSSANFERFTRDFAECVDNSFTKIYAIARDSKVTADQFVKVCDGIGAPIRRAPAAIESIFDMERIEAAFVTREYAFNAVKLRERARRDLATAGVRVELRTTAERVEQGPADRLAVLTNRGDRLFGRSVIACVYGQTNTLLRSSGLPILPLKNELAEIALLEPPAPLAPLGVTIMDGPYCSVMPFPALGVHSIHHVRYSPHHYWHDLETERNAYEHLAQSDLRSNWNYMQADAARYMPSMSQARHVRSLFEVKTVLMQNEVDDGRPILYRPDHGLRNFSVFLGAKIDNLYDALVALDQGALSGQEP